MWVGNVNCPMIDSIGEHHLQISHPSNQKHSILFQGLLWLDLHINFIKVLEFKNLILVTWFVFSVLHVALVQVRLKMSSHLASDSRSIRVLHGDIIHEYVLLLCYQHNFELFLFYLGSFHEENLLEIFLLITIEFFKAFFDVKRHFRLLNNYSFGASGIQRDEVLRLSKWSSLSFHKALHFFKERHHICLFKGSCLLEE